MTLILHTERLRLILESTEGILARISGLSPADRAEVSEDWLARLRSSPSSPWTHGFALVERTTDTVVGSAAFKGPPTSDGAVEIAYVVDKEYRGRGFAKEAAAALVEHAISVGVRLVCAHTLPERGPSTGVLEACGFDNVGEILDPEDGLVWRWEFRQRDIETGTG